MCYRTFGTFSYCCVWAAFLPADLAPATVSKKLSQLEGFYQHSDTQLGPRRLDDALADFDVEVLSSALDGYFLTLRNLPSFTPTSEDRWQVALQFTTDIAQRITRNLQPESLNALNENLCVLSFSTQVTHREAEASRADSLSSF
jgi:hypothetical protein